VYPVKVPLFPLRTVLYPGGPLPLRIFEARYLDMISNCLKTDTPFGVLLIREGNETGPADTFDVGTLAKISDWYQGSDGLLGVTAVGQKRFRLLATSRQADGLNIGTVELIDDDLPIALPEKYQGMAQILAGVLGNLGRLYEPLDKNYSDAGWVSYRFAEILPIAPEEKQSCLEIDDPIERLIMVQEVLREVRSAEPPEKRED
jgi:Lon protease-like protein